MRVLHIGAGSLYGGIATLLFTLARYRHLCPDMTPEFALCFGRRRKTELIGEGVGFHHLGAVRIRYPVSVWRARRRLREILAGGPVWCRRVPRELGPGRLWPYGSACG